MEMRVGLSKLEKIEELAKRRGFFWPSSELYGGMAGLYDYGHLGSALKRRWENAWRAWFLAEDNCYEIDPAQVMHESVWIASGHATNFVDPMARCTKCGTFHRADHIMEEFLRTSFEGMTPQQLTELIRKHKVRCPSCKGALADVAVLNMMFPLSVGSEAAKAYLRPETAQGVYVNFRRLYEHGRKALPLGVAAIGKAFRNEISPRQLLIRMREFTQAELQVFFDPAQIESHPKFEDVATYALRLYSVADRTNGAVREVSCADAVSKLKLPKFYVYHLAKIQRFYLQKLGVPKEKFRFRELSAEERAFYNQIHWDVELYLESLGGFKEMGGLHYRTDHDLSSHAKQSKQNMSIAVRDRSFIPHVLELSFGVDRNVFALLDLAHNEDGERIVLSFPRALSPYDCAVLPLLSRDGLPEKAQEVIKALRNVGFVAFYDDSGSIGRRYRRADEAGIPACITVDHQTLENGMVTLRDRDSMAQVRIHVTDIASRLCRFIAGEPIQALGTAVKK
ncbi:MAG: glycine--tRNA ligase [Candidatus Aenigmatarchaeota archaeon]